MTPEQLDRIREYDRVAQAYIHAWEEDQADPIDLIENIADSAGNVPALLLEVDRLRAQNADLLQQINTDSDVMYLQNEEIRHYKAQLEETKP